jgi:hypothetical protein
MKWVVGTGDGGAQDSYEAHEDNKKQTLTACPGGYVYIMYSHLSLVQ